MSQGLRQEHGDDALELLARIKRSFDPLDILNPGKVVRSEAGGDRHSWTVQDYKLCAR